MKKHKADSSRIIDTSKWIGLSILDGVLYTMFLIVVEFSNLDDLKNLRASSLIKQLCILGGNVQVKWNKTLQAAYTRGIDLKHSMQAVLDRRIPACDTMLNYKCKLPLFIKEATLYKDTVQKVNDWWEPSAILAHAKSVSVDKEAEFLKKKERGVYAVHLALRGMLKYNIYRKRLYLKRREFELLVDHTPDINAIFTETYVATRSVLNYAKTPLIYLVTSKIKKEDVGVAYMMMDVLLSHSGILVNSGPEVHRVREANALTNAELITKETTFGIRCLHFWQKYDFFPMPLLKRWIRHPHFRLDIRCAEGGTMLFCAIQYHLNDVVTLLLERGASVKTTIHPIREVFGKRRVGYNVLHWAICYNFSLEAFQKHIPEDEFQTLLHQHTGDGDSLLDIAEDTDVCDANLKIMMDAQPPLRSKTQGNMMHWLAMDKPFHWKTLVQHPNAALMCNQRDSRGWLPVMEESLYHGNYPNLTAALYRLTAEKDAVTQRRGFNVFHQCARFNRFKIMKKLYKVLRRDHTERTVKPLFLGMMHRPSLTGRKGTPLEFAALHCTVKWFAFVSTYGNDSIAKDTPSGIKLSTKQAYLNRIFFSSSNCEK
jgi:hypothetical protein